jgi:hypothetical protein
MTMLDVVVALASVLGLLAVCGLWWWFFRYLIKTSEPIEVKWVKGSRTFTDSL